MTKAEMIKALKGIGIRKAESQGKGIVHLSHLKTFELYHLYFKHFDQ